MRWAAFWFQVAGVLVSAFGIGITWHDFAKGRKWWAPAYPAGRAIRAGWQWLWKTRPPYGSLEESADRPIGVTITATGAVAAAAAVAPSVTADLEGFVRVLAERVGGLTNELRTLDGRMASEETTRSDEDAALSVRLESGLEGQEQLTRDVATGGLQVEAFGVLLVMIGLGLQAWADLMAPS